MYDPVKFNKYSKISDDVYLLGMNAILKMNVHLYSNSEQYGKLSYHREYEYYDKKHLFCLSKEPNIITPGNKKKIVNYKDWNIALFTCYDIRFPSWCRNTYLNNNYGYDIAIYVASWAESRSFAWNSLLIGRAIENIAYTIGVNRVGIDNNGIRYNGDSAILNYKGETLARAEKEKEEIVYHLLDKQSLLSFRQSFPFGRDWD